MLTTEQTSSVDAYASLYAMKAKKEIEAAVLQRNTTPDNENLRQLQMEISILSAKLATIPGMGLHSLRLYRDVVIQQKLLEFLVPLFEQARIDEQKNIPVLLVLDKAIPAERKSKPQRSLIVFLAAFFACTGSILLIFVMHGIMRSEITENVIIKKLKSIVYSIALFYRIPISK